MNWKRINYILHRDLGFLCIGLTLVYALSGIVVNHASREFNPNFVIERSMAQIYPMKQGEQPSMNMVKSVLEQLKIDGEMKNIMMPDRETMRIMLDGYNVNVHMPSGDVMIEKFEKRPVLFEVNYLHLNRPKGSWTIIADIYAVLLAFLAISGLLMIRKKTMKRGLVLTMVGFLIPIGYLIYFLP